MKIKEPAIRFNRLPEETGYIDQIRSSFDGNIEYPSVRSSPQEIPQQPDVVPVITTLNFAMPTDLSTSSHNEDLRSEVSERDIQAAMIFENYESPAQ